MAKEEKEKKTKGQTKATKTTSKKEQMKKAHKVERDAIKNEKRKLEEKIDNSRLNAYLCCSKEESVC